ncbi:MAG: type I-E CRISPR-associated protein Cse1/CasA [Sedimenticola sp.]
MNLIKSPWIPIRRQSGSEEQIAPWQLTETDDPVIALAAPRPDFNGALLQFLIGLMQTACPPECGEEWGDWLVNPPLPETLKQCFESVADYFNLAGDGPLFMQAFEPLKGDEKPIANLLIDAPGTQTRKQNADHFIKRGSTEQLCPSCAATALFTLQTNAPGGGAGHRTSLRGGGPLSTLVALDPAGSQLDNTLWRTCWLNVLEKITFDRLADGNLIKPETTFPWLTSTRTSEAKTGKVTTPLDSHPLQMYWGMPRRIRLNWSTTEDSHCGLCNRPAAQQVSHYITQNYGVNYTGAWIHPLSPHATNQAGELLPQHAQPGGLSYRHWLGLVSEQVNRQSARVVSTFLSGNRKLPQEQFRLHTFGYDMDNMKARCWYEATFPLYPLGESIREQFTFRTKQLIEAATDTAGVTRRCIKEAWFKRPGDAKGDTAFLIESFFSHTESDFYTSLKQLKEQLDKGEDGKALLELWHGSLKKASLALFDHWTCRGDFATVNPRRIAQAYRKLNNWLHGKKLRTTILGLPNKKEKAA